MKYLYLARYRSGMPLKPQSFQRHHTARSYMGVSPVRGHDDAATSIYAARKLVSHWQSLHDYPNANQEYRLPDWMLP